MSPVHAHHSNKIKTEKCCQKKTSKKDSNHKDCCDKGCNPFLSCCSLMGFTIEIFEPTYLIKSIDKSPLNFTYNEMLSAFEGKAWQPPKI